MRINQIETFIRDSKAKDLAVFLKENQNYIYRYSDELFKRLSELYMTLDGYGRRRINAVDRDSIYDFICALFLHRKEITTEVEFNLLERSEERRVGKECS